MLYGTAVTYTSAPCTLPPQPLMWTRTVSERVPYVIGEGLTWNASMLRWAGGDMFAIGTVPPFEAQPFETGVVVVVVVVVVVAAAITAVWADWVVPSPSGFLAVTVTRIVLPAFELTSVKVELVLLETSLHAPPTASHCFQS